MAKRPRSVREVVEQDRWFAQFCLREWFEYICDDTQYVYDVIKDLRLVCKSWDRAIQTFPTLWIHNLPWKERFEVYTVRTNEVERSYRFYDFSIVGYFSFVLDELVITSNDDATVWFSIVPDLVRDLRLLQLIRDWLGPLKRGKQPERPPGNPIPMAAGLNRGMLMSGENLSSGQVVNSRRFDVSIRFVSTFWADQFVLHPMQK